MRYRCCSDSLKFNVSDEAKGGQNEQAKKRKDEKRGFRFKRIQFLIIFQFLILYVFDWFLLSDAFSAPQNFVSNWTSRSIFSFSSRTASYIATLSQRFSLFSSCVLSLFPFVFICSLHTTFISPLLHLFFRKYQHQQQQQQHQWSETHRKKEEQEKSALDSPSIDDASSFNELTS